MASDSIANASSIPIASSNRREFAKKKRANRSAKLKQCKLDARREQWLSQVKKKGSKEEANGGGTNGKPMLPGKERGKSIEKLEIKSRSEEENEVLTNNYSDSDSPSYSPTSHTSSVLGSNDSGMNFSGTSSHSSSSSSGGCCSEIMSEEDGDGDDDCLDDWEAIADALAATDDKQQQHDPNLDFPRESNENGARMDSRTEVKMRPNSGIVSSEPKQECEVTVQGATAANFRAWRPDDAFRPQGLPTLSKQFSFPMNTERHCGRGGTGRGCSVGAPPTLCPICCEDLDLTDTSFLPCFCGFRLCLFCHKRILEEDGRCPGCRKQYDHDAVEGETSLDGGSLTFRLARSCSMGTNTRS